MEAIVAALRAVNSIEREFRAYAAGRDLVDRESADIALRQATALRKPLEKWVALRASVATKT